MEVKYYFEPCSNELVLMFEILVRCPKCGANSKYAVMPTPIEKKKAEKTKPEKPNYIG